LYDVSGSVPIPNADLVLLRSRVLLGPGQGGPFAELEAAVDPPERRKSGGERRPPLEGGRGPPLGHPGGDGRGGSGEIGPEKLAPLRAHERLEKIPQLLPA